LKGRKPSKEGFKSFLERFLGSNSPKGGLSQQTLAFHQAKLHEKSNMTFGLNEKPIKTRGIIQFSCKMGRIKY